MGWSFRAFYGWLVEKGIIDPEIKEDVLCPTCENRVDLNLLEY